MAVLEQFDLQGVVERAGLDKQDRDRFMHGMSGKSDERMALKAEVCEMLRFHFEQELMRVIKLGGFEEISEPVIAYRGGVVSSVEELGLPAVVSVENVGEDERSFMVTRSFADLRAVMFDESRVPSLECENACLLRFGEAAEVSYKEVVEASRLRYAGGDETDQKEFSTLVAEAASDFEEGAG